MALRTPPAKSAPASRKVREQDRRRESPSAAAGIRGCWSWVPPCCYCNIEVLQMQHESSMGLAASHPLSALSGSPSFSIRRKIYNRTSFLRTAEDACHRNSRQNETLSPAIPLPLLLHAYQSLGTDHPTPPPPPTSNITR